MGLGVIIIALTAHRGAGKTTLADAIVERVGARHLRVSDWLADQLGVAGQPVTPDALREVGELAAMDPEALVERSLAWSGWAGGEPLIFDSVRHTGVLAALRARPAPTRVLHVGLTVPELERKMRLDARGDAEQVLAGALHSTEADVPALLLHADLVLDTSLPTSMLLERLLPLLGQDLL